MTQASDPHRFAYHAPTILIDGAENIFMDTSLDALQFSESEGGLATVEITLRAAGHADGDGLNLVSETDYAETITLGKRLKVKAGPINEQEDLFDGVVSAVELILSVGDPPKLVLLAEDALQKSRMARRSKVHQPGTLAALIQTVAQESGLQAETQDLSQNIGVEFQANESDLAFLRRICAKYGADLRIDGQRLKAYPKAESAFVDLTLTYNETVSELRLMADLADQVTSVTMRGWDHAAAQRFSVTSNSAAHGPGDGSASGALLTDAFGSRAEHVAELPVHEQAQAQATVDALYHARSRRFVTVEGRCDPGQSLLRLGKVVEIFDAGPRFSNKYYVTDTTHRFSKESSAYVTEFRACSAVWKAGGAS